MILSVSFRSASKRQSTFARKSSLRKDEFKITGFPRASPLAGLKAEPLIDCIGKNHLLSSCRKNIGSLLMRSRIAGRDLISMADLSKVQIDDLLDATQLIKRHGAPSDVLKGKILASCFFEPSTRTRLSFGCNAAPWRLCDRFFRRREHIGAEGRITLRYNPDYLESM